jgi:hypothetical protein
MKFTGTDNYVATDDLRMAVDAAVALQRPLLIKGEPGTGFLLSAALDIPVKLTTEITRADNNDIIFFIIFFS